MGAKPKIYKGFRNTEARQIFYVNYQSILRKPLFFGCLPQRKQIIFFQVPFSDLRPEYCM